MDKQYAKFMRCGKLVINRTGEAFKLLDNMDERHDDVAAILVKNEDRYRLIRCWQRNWANDESFRARFKEDIVKLAAEADAYEERILVADVEPANYVRFITSSYKEKFKVRDLDCVMVNDEKRMVVYVDETHFSFADGKGSNLFGGCFHICQYAELCEKNGIRVAPIKEGEAL